MAHPYSFGFFMRGLLGLTLSASAVSASAQNTPTGPTPVSVTAGAVYSQNFDGMGATGTAYPAGWAGLRYGRGATNTTAVINEALTPTVLADGSTAGAVYNAGPNAGTDRALGTLGSGSTIPAFGAAFINNTGATVTQVNIAARLEQWRAGSNNTANETVVFEYSLNATNLESGTTSTWTPVTALDLVELATTTTTAAPSDGNAAANNRAISGSITNLNWPVNTTMWIRWRDNDDAGSDALLAVDNFALSTGTTTLSSRKASGAGNVAVFPNPTSEVVTIQVAGRAEKAAVTVSDLTGRVVLRGTAAADGTFSLRPLQAGNYILLVQNGDTFTTHKVTKQ
ncbi:T9SS type A sorting domain-containing protein [Hymenobacter sublimis]|uniref:T9SS type A sorting domain-containing protein n=1 Tax=Hymenobacter sublimis TaxID=2933777 RepID=A0ABY4JDB4_9BACT|nr:T9SS type A sorting domain-containing protein [Hymenobacter sublimis]UPL49932.1 T9SS type A sorting domain-containing protein [Hymenobacter sublimis]